MSELIEIMPCLFCGEQPEVFVPGSNVHDGIPGAEMIECTTDGCVNPHVSYHGVNVARKKWNTRASVVVAAAGQA